MAILIPICILIAITIFIIQGGDLLVRNTPFVLIELLMRTLIKETGLLLNFVAIAEKLCRAGCGAWN